MPQYLQQGEKTHTKSSAHIISVSVAYKVQQFSGALLSHSLKASGLNIQSKWKTNSDNQLINISKNTDNKNCISRE